MNTVSIAGVTANTTSFNDTANNVTAGHESVQVTAYSILALNAVNRPTYLNKIIGAANYISSIHLTTGGFEDVTGDGENNEITGEALWGMSIAQVYNTTKNIFYPTIQAAVNDANPGNTITVAAGTYSETVTVNKALTISGISSPTVTKFILTANPVTITGFSVATIIDLGTGGSPQNAIDAAAPGGTVNIPSGTYPAFIIDGSSERYDPNVVFMIRQGRTCLSS